MSRGRTDTTDLPAADAIVKAGVTYHGFSVLNTDATNAVTLVFREGTISGRIVGAVKLLAGESVDVERTIGTYCPTGVFLDVTGTGTFVGALYWS